MLIKPGAVARAVPTLFCAVPMNDATKMRADGRHLVDPSVFALVASNLVHPTAENGSLTGFDVLSGFYFARRQPIKVLLGDIEILFGKGSRSTNRFSRRVIKRFPRILFARYKICQKHARD